MYTYYSNLIGKFFFCSHHKNIKAELVAVFPYVYENETQVAHYATRND